ncbi:MAG: hypothetical protein K2X87_18835 [Gemmataceae bacterium]|nr:hypothetical protein [Gemmataceae bacterium]
MPVSRSTLAGLALLVAGCGGSSPTPAPVAAPGPTPTIAPAGPGGPPAPTTAEANLAYWNGMNSVPVQMAQHFKDGPDAQVWAFRRGAEVIRQHPTLGIDPDLVAWALRMADLLERRAALIAQSRSPALLAEAFVRGWNGDPFGVAIELNQAEREWVAACRAHRQEWNRLRAALTARYGVQFP